MVTYKEVQEHMSRTYGFIPKTCWIAHVKELSGMPMRRVPNRIGEGRVLPCPLEHREAIRRALADLGMIP